MKTLPLWLVQGSSGYETQWNIAVCVSEVAAKRLVDECAQWFKVLNLRSGGHSHPYWYEVENDIEQAIRAGFLPNAPDQQIVFSGSTDVVYDYSEIDMQLNGSQDIAELVVAVGARLAGDK